MPPDTRLVPVSESGKRVLELIKIDARQASELMAALSPEEQASLVSFQAGQDPKGAQELLFLVDDDKSRRIVGDLDDRSLFRIMKSQSSTHIGMLSLLSPDRIQSILDLDQELFSARGTTDPQTAYHWLVSLLEEDDEKFSRLLRNLDIKVVATVFQEKIVRPWAQTPEEEHEDESATFPADFLVKLDRGELKPDDIEVTDEETLDILTKVYLADEAYFNELISLILRDEDLKTKAAEEAFDRIHEQVGDMSQATEEAEDMFVPLED
ncbi:MAG: hypothetical protein HY914_11455 [Desulfomonile tiedjei]|nr:hypothetical protein [Desulfomonile tiedjei]